MQTANWPDDWFCFSQNPVLNSHVSTNLLSVEAIHYLLRTAWCMKRVKGSGSSGTLEMRQSGWDPSCLPSGMPTEQCKSIRQEQCASLHINACPEDIFIISQYSDKMMALHLWKWSNGPLPVITELSSMRSASERAIFEGGEEEIRNTWSTVNGIFFHVEKLEGWETNRKASVHLSP